MDFAVIVDDACLCLQGQPSDSPGANAGRVVNEPICETFAVAYSSCRRLMIEGGAPVVVVVVVAVVFVTLQNVVQSKVAVLTADQGPWLWRL